MSSPHCIRNERTAWRWTLRAVGDAWLRGARRLSWLVALACLTAAAWAQPPRALDVAWWADASGRAGVGTVLTLPPSAWTAAADARLNAGYTRAPHWFRLRLPGGSDALQLRIDNPLLDDIRVHVVEGVGPGRMIELGARKPFADRPVPGTVFRVPLQLSEHEPTEWLVRVESRSSMQVAFVLETPAQASRAERHLLLVNGVFIGIMLAMAVYNACLLISTRDRTYAWYVGWVLMFGLFSASMVGAAYEWLWPQSPAWNAASRPVLLALATACAMLFARDFLGPSVLTPLAARGFSVLAGVSGLWAAASGWLLPYQPAIHGAIVLAIVAMLLAPAAAWSAWRAGSQAAIPYLAAFGFVIAAGFLLAANKIGWLASNVWIEHAPQVGAAVESLLLSFALAARLNEERRLRQAAQRAAERSAAEAGRLADLSRRDGLTGLYNRRHLEAWLDAPATGPDPRGPVALLMVDIDHFKALNDRHGHAAGDDCIRAVAAVLARHARRAGEMAARYGGEEFCLLLPGCRAQAALAVGEAIRTEVAALRIRHEGVVLQLTVSVGVSAAEVLAGDAPRAALARADQALYAAKTAGRDRVLAAAPA